MAKRLYRSTSDKKISGVCAGFAEYFDIDPTLVRLGIAALIIATGFFPGAVFYIICAIIIPEQTGGYQTYEAPTVVVEPKMDPVEPVVVNADDSEEDEIIVEAKIQPEETSKVNLDK